MKYHRYQICTYDLWGNEKDGYDVNNIFSIGTDFVFAEEIINDDKKLIRALKKILGLSKQLRFSSFDIDGDDQMVYVNYRNIPVCELRLEKIYDE